jgi:hypothetical protein
MKMIAREHTHPKNLKNFGTVIRSFDLSHIINFSPAQNGDHFRRRMFLFVSTFFSMVCQCPVPSAEPTMAVGHRKDRKGGRRGRGSYSGLVVDLKLTMLRETQQQHSTA